MSENKIEGHTATPWHIEKPPTSSVSRIRAGAFTIPHHWNGSAAPAEIEANNNLIFLAVNSYDSMLAALKAAHAIIESMRAEHRLHGQITSASADYLHHAKPLIDAVLATEQTK